MKLKDTSRTLAILKDKHGNVVKRKIINNPFRVVVRKLGIEENIDAGDKIILEGEGN